MPCDYKNYPKNWKEIRWEILVRAADRCEWREMCLFFPIWTLEGIKLAVPSGKYDGAYRCLEVNKAPALSFKGKVVLTIAHLCHKTKCARRKHLMAMCQLHHNRYDAKHRAENRKRRSAS